MASTFTNPTPWTSKNLDTSLGSSRRAFLRCVLAVFVFGVLGYLLLFPIYLFLGALRGLASPHKHPPALKLRDE